MASTRLCGLIAVALVTLLDTATLAERVESEEHLADEEEVEEPNVRRVRFKLGVEAEYDDNILNLREDALAEFESGDFDPDRYLIESVDDTVWEPEMTLSFGSTPENRKTSGFGVAVKAVRPADNDILEYERYQLFFDQDLTDTRPEIDHLELEAEELDPRAFQNRRKFLLANRSRLKVAYHLTDNRYSGQLRDDDVGDRKSAFHDSEAWEVRYLQRLNRAQQNRLQLLLRYVLEDRDYNQAFDERDSEAERYAIGLNLYHLLRRSYWLLEGYYEFTDLESNTALIGVEGPGGTIQDDLSSERDLIGLRWSLNWYRARGEVPLRKANRARFGAVWAVKDYTTANQLDLTHFGREDDAVRYTFDYTHALRDNLTLVVVLRYSEQETNRFIEDRLETTTFDEFRFLVGFNFYAGKRLN